MYEKPFPMSRSVRKKRVSQARERFRELQVAEARDISYGKQYWPIYDSIAYGKNGILTEFIDAGIITRGEIDEFFVSSQRTVVELGGSGARFAQNLHAEYPGHIGKTFGLTAYAYNPSRPETHMLIAGDVSIPFREEGSPYNTIVNDLGENKVDLVVSRMRGGLHRLPKDPYLLAQVVKGIYENLLSQDGIMLFEFPRSVGDLIPEWVSLLNHQGIMANAVNGCLLIRRNSKSPTTLPLLDLPAIRRVYKEIYFARRIYRGIY